jgi:2-keto-3-deoxy-L-rhamnonate aldolase RhmA
MLASSLKQKIREGKRPLGMLMTYDFWPGYLEIAQRGGLDFVVVDMEHGQANPSRIEELCRTGRLLDLPTLVRPALCQFEPIRRALDLGAGGLMLPWVETQEQLDALLALGITYGQGYLFAHPGSPYPLRTTILPGSEPAVSASPPEVPTG